VAASFCIILTRHQYLMLREVWSEWRRLHLLKLLAAAVE
jgi:hypothetical protein